MKVSFDKLNRFEKPTFILCNPGSKLVLNSLQEPLEDTPDKAVGVITHTSDEEAIPRFNELSELNFRAYRPDDDGSEQTAASIYVYDRIQNRRLVYATRLGYFVITGCTAETEGDLKYKDVKAESIECELQNKIVPFLGQSIEGTTEQSYTYTLENLLAKVIAVCPGWSVVTPLPETLTGLSRTFEEVGEDTNVLGFLLENVQDAFECIFDFDIMHRTITVYDQNNYVRLTSIHLTNDDLIKTISVEENSDELYTALRVYGADDLTIHEVNPIGGGVIYNFDYYLSWMSSGLAARVTSWKAAIAANADDYYNYGLAYQTALVNKLTAEQEVNKQQNLINLYNQLYANIGAAETLTEETAQKNIDNDKAKIIAAGGSVADIGTQKAQAQAKVDEYKNACVAARNAAQSQYEDYEEDCDEAKANMKTISDVLNFETYFAGYLDELTNYIYEGAYKDEYITVTDSMTGEDIYAQKKALYDKSVREIVKVSAPTQEFSLDVENFIFEKKFEAWGTQLEAGSIINAEIEEDNVAGLFLTEFTVNYEDKTLSMTFGNRFSKFDTKALYQNALGQISKTANSVSYIEDAVYPLKNGTFDRMREELQISRNLSMSAALATSDQEIIIDASGYTGKAIDSNGEALPAQIKIVNDQIVFTTDGWRTCATAIGKIIYIDSSGVARESYGVNAQTLIGDIILAQQLKIRNEDSSVDINEVGIALSHDTIDVENEQVFYKDVFDGDVAWADSSLSFPTAQVSVYFNRIPRYLDTSTPTDVIFENTLQRHLFITNELYDMTSNMENIYHTTNTDFTWYTWCHESTLSIAMIEASPTNYYNVTFTPDENATNPYALCFLACYTNGVVENSDVYLFSNSYTLDPIHISAEDTAPQPSIWKKILQLLSKYTSALKLLFMTFASRLSDMRGYAQEIVQQHFYDVGFHIHNQDTGTKSAMTADMLMFADEKNNEYSYYGREDAFVPLFGTEYLMADNAAISDGFVNASDITRGGFNIMPLGSCTSEIAANSDLNSFTTPGAYGITGNDRAGTLANRPSNKAGMLYVIDGAGSMAHSDWNSIFLIQRYVVYDTSAVFERRVYSLDRGTTWTTTAWRYTWIEAPQHQDITASRTDSNNNTVSCADYVYARRDGSSVCISFKNLKNLPGGTTSTVVGQVPSGWAPTWHSIEQDCVSPGGYHVRIKIDTSGNITITNYSSQTGALNIYTNLNYLL